MLPISRPVQDGEIRSMIRLYLNREDCLKWLCSPLRALPMASLSMPGNFELTGTYPGNLRFGSLGLARRLLLVEGGTAFASLLNEDIEGLARMIVQLEQGQND